MSGFSPLFARDLAVAGPLRDELLKTTAICQVPGLVEGCQEHDPVRVVDDLEMDETRRPAKWLWHLECYRCGEVLDLDLEPSAVAR